MSEMGLTRRPVFEIFGNSQQIAGSPMYAPALRQAALEDQMVQSNQRQLDMDLAAQDALTGYVQQEPSTRQKFLEDNPVIATSPQFGDVARYETLMGPSAADKTLLPSLSRKLPPALRQSFYDNVQKGMGVLGAFDAAESQGEQLALKEKLYGTGASDEDIAKAFPDGQFDAARVARFEAQRKLAAEKDPETSAIDKYHTMLTRQAKLEYDTTGAVTPETDSERIRVAELLASKLKSKLPGATPVVEEVKTTEVVPTPENGLRNTLKAAAAGGAAPVVSRPVDPYGVIPGSEMLQSSARPVEKVIVTPEQIIKQTREHIDSGDADETFFSVAVANPALPASERKHVLEKFREFVKNPPPRPGSTVGEALKRREDLNEKLKEAERMVDYPEEAQKYSQAWTESKKEIDDILESFASSIGVTKDQVVNSLVKNESVAVPQKNGRPEYKDYRTLLSEFWAQKNGSKDDLWRKEVEKLSAFSKSKFAKELGEKPMISSLPGLSEALTGEKKKYADVLDAYLQEKAGTSSGAQVAPTDPAIEDLVKKYTQPKK